jgi:hypothetical protein
MDPWKPVCSQHNLPGLPIPDVRAADRQPRQFRVPPPELEELCFGKEKNVQVSQIRRDSK